MKNTVEMIVSIVVLVGAGTYLVIKDRKKAII